MKKSLETILAVAIFGSVLAFGGVQTITYSIMEVVLFGLLLALLTRQTLAGEIRLPLPVWPVLFIALVAFQLVPLPAGLLGKLSPPRMADLAMNPGATWAAISIYPRETWLGLVKLLAYVSAFVLAA